MTCGGVSGDTEAAAADRTGAAFGGSGRETGAACGGAGRHKDAVVDIIAKPLCRDECRARLEDCCRRGDNDVDAPPSKFVGVAPLRFAEWVGSYASGDGYITDPLQKEVRSSTASSSKIGGVSSCATPCVFDAAGGRSGSSIDELNFNGFDINSNYNNINIGNIIGEVEEASIPCGVRVGAGAAYGGSSRETGAACNGTCRESEGLDDPALLDSAELATGLVAPPTAA